jgi:hypothetical protein
VRLRHVRSMRTYRTNVPSASVWAAKVGEQRNPGHVVEFG